MKKVNAYIGVLAAMMFSAASHADQVVSSTDDLGKIIQARVKEHQAGKIGNYKQVWGDSNPLIDSLIKQSAANFPATIIEAITNAKGNAFSGATKSCVDDMAMSNNGAYYNTLRYCTTTYGDRNYMHNVVYPSLTATMMASVFSPAVEIGTFAPDYTFITFYTPSGYASEFLMIRNLTQ